MVISLRWECSHPVVDPLVDSVTVVWEELSGSWEMAVMSWPSHHVTLQYQHGTMSHKEVKPSDNYLHNPTFKSEIICLMSSRNVKTPQYTLCHHKLTSFLIQSTIPDVFINFSEMHPKYISYLYISCWQAIINRLTIRSNSSKLSMRETFLLTPRSSPSMYVSLIFWEIFYSLSLKRNIYISQTCSMSLSLFFYY